MLGDDVFRTPRLKQARAPKDSGGAAMGTRKLKR